MSLHLTDDFFVTLSPILNDGFTTTWVNVFVICGAEIAFTLLTELAVAGVTDPKESTAQVMAIQSNK